MLTGFDRFLSLRSCIRRTLLGPRRKVSKTHTIHIPEPQSLTMIDMSDVFVIIAWVPICAGTTESAIARRVSTSEQETYRRKNWTTGSNQPRSAGCTDGDVPVCYCDVYV